MSFYKKYKKYKNKYNILKKQNGGTKIGCANNMYFINRHETCWNVSIQMIFLFSDQTSDIIQKNIRDSSDDIICSALDNDELKECLPFDFFENNIYSNELKDNIYINIIKLFDEHRERLLNKNVSNVGVVPMIRRQKSESCETNFSLSFFNLIYEKDDLIFKQTNFKGFTIDDFLLVLLFSVFLYKKLVEFIVIPLYTSGDFDYWHSLNSYYTKAPIAIIDITRSIGVLIRYKYHVCCFYKCLGKYKYYDSSQYNNLIRDFNLLDFIRCINQHVDDNKKYYIFQYCGNVDDTTVPSFLKIYTPFLLCPSDNKIYYCDSENNIVDITNAIITDKLMQNILISPLFFSFLNFVILYDSKKTHIEYKHKYMSIYLDYYIFNKNINFDVLNDKYEHADINDKLYLKHHDYKMTPLEYALYKKKYDIVIKILNYIQNVALSDKILLDLVKTRNYDAFGIILDKIKIIVNIEILELLIVNRKFDLAKIILTKYNDKESLKILFDSDNEFFDDTELLDQFCSKID